jgi:hypothetical protein
VTRRRAFELRSYLEKWKQAVEDSGDEEDRKKRRNKEKITNGKDRKDAKDKQNGKEGCGYWEGEPAYEELKSTGFLNAVLLEGPLWEPNHLKPKDWRSREAIGDVSSEIRLYHAWVGKVVELNARYR